MIDKFREILFPGYFSCEKIDGVNLARNEGILCGISSGAAVHAAKIVAQVYHTIFPSFQKGDISLNF